jgi:fibro-slime domain-containing protein
VPCVLASAWALACSPTGERKVDHGNGSTSVNSGSGGLNLNPEGTGGGGLSIGCDPLVPGSPCSPEAAAPPNCGDGKLGEDEACDDGNREGNDGCQGNCLAVQPGYSCSPPGKPCHELVICGDGIVGSSEQCDDGNQTVADGCSATCKFEVGFKCQGQPSACTPTVCGDGVKEGAESCDDKNPVPFDGCSSTCQTEPGCSANGCTSECGDGLLIDEECDDGNTKDGDGCSSMCKKEPGFECSQKASCEKINGACVLRVPVIYRDFNAPHADFAVDCKGQAGGLEATPGLVATTLTNGAPTATAAAPASCITKLGDWYSDAGAPAIVRDLVLFDNGKGGYVNRFGPMGEQWATQPVYTGRWCGNGDTQCIAAPPAFGGCDFDPAVDTCFYPCPRVLGSATDTCAGTATTPKTYDGTPLFFPLDDQPKTEPWIDAKVPPQYGYDWSFEDTVVPVYGAPHVASQAAHNFHFTSQVVYWFKYDAATTARLDFTGDDDVWVFVNGTLAVDLGGVHQPVDGSVSISAATAAKYGLTNGKVYQITVFQAERKQESSSFRLTLAGFDTARSECTPICGDAIVSLGEQCDDGVNDGGYGECGPNCRVGPYCGDGMKQENEQYDDDNRITNDGCSTACRIERIK